MANVAVYIIHSDDKKTERVINIFKNDLFLINEIEIEKPAELPFKLLSDAASFELYKYHKILTDSREKYPNTPVLIIYDTSITATSQDIITDVITSALNREDWEVFYLYKYMDLCGQHNKQSDVPETMIKIVKTESPYGTQALLFTPDGRDMILGKIELRDGGFFEVKENSDLNLTLNKYIEEGKLFAITSNPNLITVDTLDFTDNGEYGKMAECRVPDELVISSQTGNYPPWIFLTGVSLLIILIIFGIYVLSQRRYGKEPREIARPLVVGSQPVGESSFSQTIAKAQS